MPMLPPTPGVQLQQQQHRGLPFSWTSLPLFPAGVSQRTPTPTRPQLPLWPAPPPHTTAAAWSTTWGVWQRQGLGRVGRKGYANRFLVLSLPLRHGGLGTLNNFDGSADEGRFS